MNILIVHAHENPSSFCSALMLKAKEYFLSLGYEVEVSDLYKINFSAVAGKQDFQKVSESSYYKFPLEQLNAQKNDLFSEELKNEMSKLEKADLLIFNFPLWWFGLPAILKGWVDRVLAYGFAYGGDYGIHDKGRFSGRKAIICTTTGSPTGFYSKEGVHGRPLSEILRNIQDGIFKIVGYQTSDPYVAYSVSRISQEERQEILENYTTFLSEIIKHG